MTERRMLPDYQADLFINRQAEIELVMTKVMAMVDRFPVDKRTVVFTGEHGMGKSWLLNHLQARVVLHTETTFAIINLNLADYFFDTAGELQPEKLIEQLYRQFFCQLGMETLANDKDGELQAHTFIQAIKANVLAKQPLLLFIDSVYEIPHPYLAIIEDRLLAPLAVEPRVLIVMAGRGQPFPWRTPELRLRAEFLTLNAFPTDLVQEQVKRQAPQATPQIEQIYQLGLGNPKATYRLATLPNLTDLVYTLDQIIDEMLSPIGADQRPIVRHHLEAFAIPRLFDYSHAPDILNAYTTNPIPQLWPRAKIRLVFDMLIKPGLVYSNSEVNAYTLHQSTRNLVIHYVQRAKPELWGHVHQAMLKLYQRWCTDYPHVQKQWMDEIEYHQSALK